MEQKRVLIADPDSFWSGKLAAALSGSGNVTAVRDGYSAKRIIESRRPQIIVMEMLLEQCDGLNLLDHIHRTDDYHPLVYIISYMPVASLGPLYRIIQHLCPGCYVAAKPQAAETVVGNLALLEQIAPQVIPASLDEQIEHLLLRLDSKLYLRRAVAAKTALRILVEDQPETFRVGDLYRRVSGEMGGDWAAAERLLRNFARAARDNNSPFYRQHFASGKPINSNFYWTAYRLLQNEIGEGR